LLAAMPAAISTGVFSVQDCEVCCNLWRVNVSGRDDDRVAHVTRGDGSE
jgi:hypothetical protein